MSVEEDDIEQIMSTLDQPQAPLAMKGSEEAAAPQSTAEAVQAKATPQMTPQQIQELEIEWSGRKIKAPIDKVRTWASQGYDYAQKMEAFKKQQQDLSEKYKGYEKYKTIDTYVQKDPQWWKHVEESYQNRLASEDPVVQRVKGMLDEQLQPFKELLTLKEQEEKAKKISAEDSALEGEIKSIRSKYKDLDFDTPDQSGKSLEFKVLEHGATNNFPSFRAAFLDFYHDQLEKMWESKGREAISKDTAKREKLGLSATKPTPRTKPESYDTRGKSYDDIFKDVMSQF